MELARLNDCLEKEANKGEKWKQEKRNLSESVNYLSQELVHVKKQLKQSELIHQEYKLNNCVSDVVDYLVTKVVDDDEIISGACFKVSYLELKQLEIEFDRVKQELNSSSKECLNAMYQNEKLKNDNIDLVSEFNGIKNQIVSLNEEKKRVRSEMEKQMIEFDEIKSQMEILKIENREANSLIDEYKTKYEVLKQDFDRSKDESERFATKNEELRNEIEELNKKLIEFDLNKELNIELLGEIERLNSIRQKENQEHKVNSEKFESKILELEGVLYESQIKMNELSLENSNLKSQKKQAENMEATLTQEYKSTFEQFELKINELEHLLQDTQLGFDALSAENNKLIITNKEAENIINELELKIEILKQESIKSREEYQLKNEQIENENEQLKEKIKELINANSLKEQEFEAILSLKEEEKLKSIESMHIDLSSKSDTIRVESIQQIDELKQKLDSKETEIEELNSKIHILEQNIQMLTNSNSKSNEVVNSLSLDYQILQNNHAECENKLAQSENECDQLKEKIKELIDTNKQKLNEIEEMLSLQEEENLKSIESLNFELSSKLEKFDELKQNLDSKEIEIDELNSKIYILEQNIQVLRNSNSKSNELLNNLSLEYQNLQNKSVDCENERAQSVIEINLLKNEFELLKLKNIESIEETSQKLALTAEKERLFLINELDYVKKKLEESELNNDELKLNYCVTNVVNFLVKKVVDEDEKFAQNSLNSKLDR
jgi:chromosome segregation ATPase